MRIEFDNLLLEGARNPQNIDQNLKRLRELVVLKGLPQETPEERDRGDHEITLRGKIWKILLRVRKIDSQKYIEYVNKGPSLHDSIICLDAKRTLQNEPDFRRRVSNEKLIRLLNAWQHYLNDRGQDEGYVQGINCYAAPFLYVMPEVDAFFCLVKLMKWHCPLYLSTGASNFPGLIKGVQLFQEILHEMDPELGDHLKKQPTETYAWEPIHSMNISLSPYTEWLQLWDMAICLGIHLHLIFAVSRVLLIREPLLAAENPNEYLSHKGFSTLSFKAKTVINVGMQIVRMLPENLYTRVLYHPFHTEENDNLDIDT
uniref:Rab-GAP TBC domain-containing protein n=1 Tax=Arcella intermedia TaxID=1963864 RepID=A0A6B2LAQ1_9EUKA